MYDPSVPKNVTLYQTIGKGFCNIGILDLQFQFLNSSSQG